MLVQYAKFFINGGVLGLLAWGLQVLIYQSFGTDRYSYYALASALTYAPLLIINFFVQRRWVFDKSGRFFRFLASNFFMMLLVSSLSPVFRNIISNTFGTNYGDWYGFVVASLFSSIPSFLLVRLWVFNDSHS